MKRFAMTVFALALVAGGAQAEDSIARGSEMSVLGGASMLVGSAAVIASPFIIVGEVVDASSRSDRVAVRVKTDRGEPETLELPRETVARVNLQRGDRLTVTPAKSGAVLAKNDTPVAFLVPPENAKLSRSHELAR